jgi:hypothetical protein
MRVDSCTKELKDCLTSDDRCGQDYTNCVGLDANTVFTKVCPRDKLIACSAYSDDELLINIEGMLLTYDSGTIGECQSRFDAKMNEVCGSNSDCPNIEENKNFGTDGLELQNDGTGLRLVGLVDFTKVEVDEDAKEIKYEEPTDDKRFKEKSKQSVVSIQRIAESYIRNITSDIKIQDCIKGKKFGGDGDKVTGRIERPSSKNTEGFGGLPNLADAAKISILESALRYGRNNYEAKYQKLLDEGITKMRELQDAKAQANQCYDPAVQGPVK